MPNPNHEQRSARIALVIATYLRGGGELFSPQREAGLPACVECGKRFEKTRRKQVVCSEACGIERSRRQSRNRIRRHREREEFGLYPQVGL